MKLDFAVICDYAGVDGSGKMVIVGAFDRINASGPAARLPIMGIALRLRCEANDDSTPHTVQVRMKAPDGNVQMQMDAQAELPRGLTPQQVEEASLPLPFLAQNIVFPRHGKYTFEVWIDNRLEHTTRLIVGPAPVPFALPQQPPPPAAGGVAH